MEFDEHEEEQEEVGAQAIGNSGRKSGGYRYRECLKNHALSVGGHALDGCGEFMAAGEDGTLDALKCAACSCHRNFHRKETNIQQQQQCHQPHQQAVQHQYIHPPPYYHHHDRPPGYLNIAPSPYFHHQRPLALPSTSREDLDEISNPSSSGGGGGGGGGGSSSKKRFRTKFTQEQKDQMLAFSERLGWRIQKHDEAVVQQFCAETGVKRHVLKVWMHNNKHTIGKKP
ncbi:putative transcription factor ZF-HD family [Helianthus annuus]|nr:putative transcription factor ZF-HD family [Helianthus annuus]KAJ0698786.1 putative transcription factor ZF-HD family [Helianthus annuus]KAJ0877690.1 putative transcription factor ZF-HD family [Helianthus annuus]